MSVHQLYEGVEFALACPKCGCVELVVVSKSFKFSLDNIDYFRCPECENKIWIVDDTEI